MDYVKLIDKYYGGAPELRDILWRHSRLVADRCLRIVSRRPELHLDGVFVEEAAMLHDIGIFGTDAPDIYCFGSLPYICHGYFGGELLRGEGYELHARVCERHTGTGLSAALIERNGWPLPAGVYMPETLEEKLVCYADKFYSKTHPDREKSIEKVLKSLSKYGEDGVRRFLSWRDVFEPRSL